MSARSAHGRLIRRPSTSTETKWERLISSRYPSRPDGSNVKSEVAVYAREVPDSRLSPTIRLCG